MIFNRPLYTAILLSLLALAFPGVVVAEPDCLARVEDVPGQTDLASASTWANLSGSASSIKNKSSEMLLSAERLMKSLEAPKNLCQQPCTLNALPEMKFAWVPNRFLENYGDLEKCTEKLKVTGDKPILYENLSFDKLEDLATWFGEFSQGKGALGSDLYNKCDGSCSPQYYANIARSNSGYLVHVRVVCGHARDKSDDQYKLSSSYRWFCTAPN